MEMIIGQEILPLQKYEYIDNLSEKDEKFYHPGNVSMGFQSLRFLENAVRKFLDIGRAFF